MPAPRNIVGRRFWEPRVRSALVFVMKAVGIVAFAVVALVGGAVLHMGLRAPRAVVASRVNRLLHGSFRGTILVRGVRHLGVTYARGVDVDVYAPNGDRVIAVRGASAELDSLRLLASVVTGRRLDVVVPSLDVASAEVLAEDDESGGLSIAETFAPTSTAPGRGADISLPRISIRHVALRSSSSSIPVTEAELDGVRGSVYSVSDMFELRVATVAVHARAPHGLDPAGFVTGSLQLPPGEDSVPEAAVAYLGRFGEIPVAAAGTLDGMHVDGSIAVPSTRAEAFNAVSSGRLKLAAPLGGELYFQGELPILGVRLLAHLGAATVESTAEIAVPNGDRRAFGVQGWARAVDFNVADINAGMPSSRMTVSIEGGVVVPSGIAPSGSFRIESEGGEFEGIAVPPATIQGTAHGASVSGSGIVLEPGAPTTVSFSLVSDAGGDPAFVSFSTQTHTPELHALPRLSLPASGAFSLSTRGSVNVRAKTLDVRGNARVSNLDASGIRLGAGSVDMTAMGPLTTPRIALHLTGQNLTSGGYAFSDVRASVEGTAKDADVTLAATGSSQAPDVDARARVHIVESGGARRLSIQRAEADIDRNRVHARVNVDSIDIAAGIVDVRGAAIVGLGDTITLGGRKTPGAFAVRATAPDVDVSSVIRLLGGKQDLQGRASFDLDVSGNRQGVDGRVVLDARVKSAKGANLDLLPPIVFGGLSLSLPPLAAATAHVGGESKNHVLRATVELDADRIGKLNAEAANVTLDGPLFEAASWLRATGTLSLDASAQVAKLVTYAPNETNAVLPTAGDLSIHARLDRVSRNALPNADIRVSTSNLELTRWRSTSSLLSADPTLLAPPNLAGVDGAAELTIEDGGDRVGIHADIHDRKGPIATLTGEASEGMGVSLSDPGKSLERLSNAPLTARLTLRESSIDELESILAVVAASSATAPRGPVTGLVSGNIDLHGTLNAPQVVATAEAKHLVVVGSRCSAPIDVQAIFRYQDRVGELRAMASTTVPILKADASISVADEPLHARGPLIWSLSGGVELMDFPLSLASHTLQTRVAGAASGTIRVVDLHQNASLDAKVSLKHVSVGHSTPTNADLSATLEKAAFQASLGLHQPNGELRVDAKGPLSWGAAYLPTLEREEGIDITLAGKNFRADAVRPFVASTFVALDGVIDADAHVHVASAVGKSRFEGTMSIREGVFEIPSVGERFHDVEAHLSLDPSGSLRVDHFVAQGPTGELEATGRAVLEGLSFKTGHAELRISKEKRIPLSVAGVPIGTASGNVALDATMASADHRLDVAVDIPTLLLTLPQSTGHSVQDLSPNPNVRIGASSRMGFRTILLAPPSAENTASPLSVRVAVKLGNDVEIKRDTTLDVVLNGDAVVDITDKTRVTGQVHLVRGKLDLEGKEFRIDQGSVTFAGGDASSPSIAARAHWQAPDGTRVYADYTGTPKVGSLRLSSEPALTQDQIVALVLYGSTSSGFGGSNGTSQGSGDIAAVGLAGGILTQSVNRIISGVTSADVTTRIDSSVANNPEPEVVAQLTKTISARIGYKLGAAAPGDNPDRPDVTVYWRFVKNWSLSADVGEEGSAAFDIVWRLRY